MKVIAKTSIEIIITNADFINLHNDVERMVKILYLEKYLQGQIIKKTIDSVNELIVDGVLIYERE